MFNKIQKSLIKTIAVIRYKTALYDFYILYSFTSVRKFFDKFKLLVIYENRLL